MKELETSLKSFTSMRDQQWEDALGCIHKKAVHYQREHKNTKQSVELQRCDSYVSPRKNQSHRRCINSFHRLD